MHEFESSPRLDSEMLSDLKDIMEEDYAVLLETYLADAIVRLDSIDAAACEQNSSNLMESAHSFKGSSLNIGASRLAGLSSNVEILAKEERLEQALPVIAQLHEEYEAVKTLLEQELSQS
ncbi:MAG: HPt (histidine-containing phosphotransfer) domain-containing protein [Candidatus Azotimanducaceae bacterium]|jgi:HPt (histidine-containing phosphotransfer) domain-containing protein